MKILNKVFFATVIGFASISVAQAAYTTVGGTTVTNGDTTYNSAGTVMTGGNSYAAYNSAGYDMDADSVIRGDNLLASAKMDNKSSPQEEINFVNDVLGTSYTTDSLDKYEPYNVAFTVTDLTNGVFSFNLTAGAVEAGYYILKFGGSDSHYLFDNTSSVADFTWLSAIQPNGPAIDNLSHVSLISAPSEVPVPAAVWLFGSALFGLVGVGRKKKEMVA